MATKRINTAEDIYQIKVTLLGTKPPIWRRLAVPASITLAKLHDVLQVAMGWDDGHMHEFRVGQRRFGRPFPDERLMGMTPTESEGTVRLSAVLGRAGAKMIYTYDFGDSWEHSIVLEKRLPADPKSTYPACTDGKLACPPEDCGGVWGFYELQEALADPRHPRHEEFVDWIGAFDPEAFSLDKVNRLLSPAPRRGKTRVR